PGCEPDQLDLHGCACSFGSVRPCYDGPPETHKKGACRDGMQTCEAMGEGGRWGACRGAVKPKPENCSDTLDNNCNGKIDCDDDECASAQNCQGTQPCTENTSRS